jgi:hypothetical protein
LKVHGALQGTCQLKNNSKKHRHPEASIRKIFKAVIKKNKQHPTDGIATIIHHLMLKQQHPRPSAPRRQSNDEFSALSEACWVASKLLTDCCSSSTQTNFTTTRRARHCNYTRLNR